MSDDHPALEKFVAQAGSLYSPPTVALEILRLTGQPKVDLAALKQCLLRDPALVGRILRVVNSSLFGLSREVADLGQALALLGTKSVRLLVLGFSLPDELFLGLAGDILERYWHHTLIKASAAREISETIFRIPGEEPFIAGLMQDIGILVLLQQLGEPYVRFLDRAFSKEINVDAAEAVALGFEHEQLSARLLAQWGLPESLVAAIAVGRSAERMDRLPLASRAMPQILHMAHLVAGLLTEGRADCLGELERVGRHYRQITSVQISAIVAALQSKVEQLAEVLSLELPAGVDYQSIFHDAHRQLSAAAEDAALALAVPGPITANETAAIEEQICSASTALAEAATQFLQAVPSNHVSTARTKVTANSTVEFPSVRSVTFVQAAALQTPPLPVAEFRSPQLSKSDSSDSIPGNRLAEHVKIAIAACRQAREPLSLVLIQLDRFHDVTRPVGATESKRFVELLGLLCGRTEHVGIVQLQTGESSLALVLLNCDRPAAGDIGHHLLRDVRRLREKHADLADAQLSVSIGVATIAMPAKNFSPASLIDSARRCLNAAQLSGGNAVKTIDVL
jgi:HD-like signal output (HDOD) protein/GGDEF domain-containing protein